MIDLSSLDYSADTSRTNPETGECNEHYRGYLDNGDLVEFSHHGYYNRPWWEWKVFVPEDYPIQCYQAYAGRTLMDIEDAIAHFNTKYRPRMWRSRVEQQVAGDVSMVRCLSCGWEGSTFDLESKTVYEDYGDVSCAVCPSCGKVEYDGDHLFEEM